MSLTLIECCSKKSVISAIDKVYCDNILSEVLLGENILVYLSENKLKYMYPIKHSCC